MPSAIIISGRIGELRQIAQALGAAGWDIVRAPEGRVALAVVDIRNAAGRIDVEQVKNDSMIMIGIAGHGAATEPYDDMIRWPFDRGAVDSVIAAWSPPSIAPLDRLARAFGMEAFRPLVEGLRGELSVALAGSELSLSAHRLAGLSGTLGFAALSTSLEAVSRGETALLGDARRHAKTAQVAIDEWLADADTAA